MPTNKRVTIPYSVKLALQNIRENITTLQNAPPGSGDMLRSTYDSNLDGKISSAQLDGVPTLPLAQSDVTNLVSDLGGKATLAVVKADADIASAISIKHSNTLDHDGSLQDIAISGKTTLSAVKSDTDISGAISHSVSAHAPSNAQRNSDITKAEIEAQLTGEIASHTHAGGSGESEVIVVLSGTVANSTVNLANATGLTFNALASSTYVIEVFLVWASSATTVGIKVSATASGTPTIQSGRFASDAANGTPDSSSWNANGVVVTTSASPFTANNLGMVHALLKTSGSASTWQLQFAAETTGTITLQAGSTLRYRKVV